jgi:hypothetical protein
VFSVGRLEVIVERCDQPAESAAASASPSQISHGLVCAMQPLLGLGGDGC